MNQFYVHQYWDQLSFCVSALIIENKSYISTTHNNRWQSWAISSLRTFFDLIVVFQTIQTREIQWTFCTFKTQKCKAVFHKFFILRLPSNFFLFFVVIRLEFGGTRRKNRIESDILSNRCVKQIFRSFIPIPVVQFHSSSNDGIFFRKYFIERSESHSFLLLSIFFSPFRSCWASLGSMRKHIFHFYFYSLRPVSIDVMVFCFCVCFFMLKNFKHKILFILNISA